MGEIVVGLRPGDLTLFAGDEQVLRIAAPLLAQTLHAGSLTRDLKESSGDGSGGALRRPGSEGA